MMLRRTSHAFYNTKYHLVWAPKYRKWIQRGDLQLRGKEFIEEIARLFKGLQKYVLSRTPDKCLYSF